MSKCYKTHRNRQVDTDEDSMESTDELKTSECRKASSETANTILNQLELSIGKILGYAEKQEPVGAASERARYVFMRA